MFWLISQTDLKTKLEHIGCQIILLNTDLKEILNIEFLAINQKSNVGASALVKLFNKKEAQTTFINWRPLENLQDVSGNIRP